MNAVKKGMTMVAVAVLGLNATMVSAGQTDPQVRKQLKTWETVLDSEGFARSHDYKYDSLRNNDNDQFTLKLDSKMEYKIVAVCDADCDDLDLALFDENGNEIDSDAGKDSNPMVEASPKWTGEFTLKVSMASCSRAPCALGVAVFAR